MRCLRRRTTGELCGERGKLALFRGLCAGPPRCRDDFRADGRASPQVGWKRSCQVIRNLSKPELERRIALLGRAAERFPEMCDAILLERRRLERVLGEKRAAKKQAHSVEVAA